MYPPRSGIASMLTLALALTVGTSADAAFSYYTANLINQPSNGDAIPQVQLTLGGIGSNQTKINVTDTSKPITVGVISGFTDVPDKNMNPGTITDYNAPPVKPDNMMVGPITTNISMTIVTGTQHQGTITIGGGLIGTAKFKDDATNMTISLSYLIPRQSGSVVIDGDTYTLTLMDFPGSGTFVAPPNDPNSTDARQADVKGILTVTPSAVPEPTSILMTLIGAGIVVPIARARRRLATA